MRRFSILPALLALAGTVAAEQPGVYLRADLAKAWNTKDSEEEEEPLADLEEQARSGVQWSLLGALMTPSKVFGGGLFYAGFQSSAELGSPYVVEDITFTKYDPVVSISVVGAAMVLRHPVSDRLVWTSEFGMGKATETDEIEFAGFGDNGGSKLPLTGDATITGDGVVLLLGTGFDWMITPTVGIGAAGRWIKGELEDPTVKMDMTVNGMTMTQRGKVDEVTEVNLVSLGGGLRLVF
jgi:hypothetical protein